MNVHVRMRNAIISKGEELARAGDFLRSAEAHRESERQAAAQRASDNAALNGGGGTGHEEWLRSPDAEMMRRRASLLVDLEAAHLRLANAYMDAAGIDSSEFTLEDV